MGMEYGSKIRDLFWLAGILIVFQGLVYFEEYYSLLGLRYYSLGVPIQDIVYKGMTLSYQSPWLLALNTLFFFAVFVDFFDVKKSGGFLRLLVAFSQISAAFVTSYFLVSAASAVEVASDLCQQTSKLRILRDFQSPDPDKTKFAKSLVAEFQKTLRILFVDENVIRLVVIDSAPCSTDVMNEYPNLMILRLGPNDYFETSGKGTQ